MAVPPAAAPAVADAAILSQIVSGLSAGVTIRGQSGELIYANPAALEMLGFASLEEIRAYGTPAMLDEYTVRMVDGAALEHSEIPSVRLLRGEEVRPTLLHMIHKDSGEERWRRLTTKPLHETGGGLVGAVTIIEDVTAVKLAELRTELLAESGRLLVSSLDYEQTLRNVAQVAVPSFADICCVSLLDDRGDLRLVAVAAENDDYRRLLEPMIGEIFAIGVGGRSPQEVLTAGQSALGGGVDETATGGTTASLDLRRLGLRSAMTVPMPVPTRTIGVLSLATRQEGRRFGEEDLALAEQLGRRAAVAVEHVRLYSKLASVAVTLGQSLLPLALPQIPDWEVASLYRPAEDDLRIDIGGDFYEFVEQQGTWFGVLGDVGGKGVRAAAITALMRHGARVAVPMDPRPCAILTRLDQALQHEPRGLLCTALCFRLDADGVRISSAGHPPALILRADGSLREAPASGGPLLGAFPDVEERPEEHLAINQGDLLVLYTDGVVEAPGQTGRFGLDRLKALISEHGHGTPEALLERVEQELAAFSVAPRRDDVAMLALRRR